MRRQLLPALRMLLVMTLITGIIYPLAITAVGLGLFPDQAAGSLISVDGEVVGSRLLGQRFDGEQFFHPRPSAVDYDSAASSGSNLGPTNADLLERVSRLAADYRTDNGLDPDDSVPVDAVTASGSGLDPHITPANARLQAPRVATVRGLDIDDVTHLVEQHTERAAGGIFGGPVVNVMELNMALEEIAP